MKPQLLSICIVSALTTCFAPANAAEQIKGQGSIKTFTMLPVGEPSEYKMRNRNLLIGGIVGGIRDMSLSSKLTEAIKLENPELGEHIKKSVADQLKRSGLSEIPMPEGISTDKINYATIKTDADAIVHIYYEGAGLFSGTLSTNYEPYLYASYCVVARKISNDCIIENSGVYGDGSKKNAPGTYVAPENERWPNSEAVEGGIKDVIASFKNGATKIATGFASDIASYSLGSGTANTGAASSPAKPISTGEKETTEIIKPPETKQKMTTPEQQSLPESKPINAVKEPNLKSSEPNDIAERMRTLERLRKEGLITETDYEAKKKELLQRL